MTPTRSSLAGHGMRTVTVSGSYDRMGAETGRLCSDLAEDMVLVLKRRLSLMNLDLGRARAISSRYLPYAEEYDQEFVDFLRGYAEGSGTDFRDIFSHFCLGERNLCTDICVNGSATSDGSVYSAHTEDWSTDYEGHVVIVRARPPNGPAFDAVSLCGAELDCGLNSASMSFTGNSLYADDDRVGVPKMFVSRRILSSRTVGEAIEAALPDRRASSYNYNICHAGGEMFCLEGSATDFELVHGTDGFLVHTNHYISGKMARHEKAFAGRSGDSPGNAPSTLLRYHRARHLLRDRLGGVDLDVLKSILADHFNHPNSICCHVDEAAPEIDRCATIFSVIFDLGRPTMHVCPGTPCSGTYSAMPFEP